jgi:hypothetical protein
LPGFVTGSQLPPKCSIKGSGNERDCPIPWRRASTQERSSDLDEDEIHAQAFRNLEGHISDCVCMGNIASQLMANARCDDEKLSFAVFHVSEVLLNLNKHYKAAWRVAWPYHEPRQDHTATQRSLLPAFGR